MSQRCLGCRINFGIAFTSPLFISLGTILGIPLNMLVDAVLRGHTPLFLTVLGCAIIAASFGLLLLPPPKDAPLLGGSGDGEGEGGEPPAERAGESDAAPVAQPRP